MKMIKSLLLGTAAGLVAMAGAQAAELPVKAKPVQYVKGCSLYDAGFYYMPGANTSIKVIGWTVEQRNLDTGSYVMMRTFVATDTRLGDGATMVQHLLTDRVAKLEVDDGYTQVSAHFDLTAMQWAPSVIGAASVGDQSKELAAIGMELVFSTQRQQSSKAFGTTMFDDFANTAGITLEMRMMSSRDFYGSGTNGFANVAVETRNAYTSRSTA